MTEQPTEQEWLGNAAHVAPRVVQPAGTEPKPPRSSYLPNGHRIRPDLAVVVSIDIEQARAEQQWGPVWKWNDDVAAADLHELPAAHDLPAEPSRQEPDLWLETETHATRALNEIQDGNINSSIAYLQSALAFALNYRHSISYGVTGQ